MYLGSCSHSLGMLFDAMLQRFLVVSSLSRKLI